MDEHDLVSAVKQLALELGRTPTRAEFVSSTKGADYKLAKIGGYTVLCQMAGLETYDQRRLKVVSNAIFEVKLERHLEAYKPEIKKPVKRPSIAVISDIHWPFENPAVIAQFSEYVASKKPEYVFINSE